MDTSVQPLMRKLFLAAVFTLLLLNFARPGHAQDTPIAIGDTVEIVPSGERINLRNAPGLQQAIVTTLEKGTRMEVVGGPQTADEIVWWELEGEPGRGWAAATFLRVVDSGTASSAPVGMEANTALGTVDAYGFSGWCFQGWRWPDLNDSNPWQVDTIQTFGQVTEAMVRLQNLGYTVRTHKNNAASEALNRLPEDAVFFFYGHGTNTGILFHSDDCKYTKLTIATPVQSPNLKLAVLLGCETGQNIDSPNNILRKFQSIGARKAIGMREVVMKFRADHWNKLFWQYATQEGMEVEDAARKAANDQLWGLYWVSPSTLVVVGDEDVYLNPNQTEPSPLPGIGPTIDPGRWFTALQTWLENLRRDLEQQFADWLQDLQKQLLETIANAVQKALDDALRQLCGTGALGALGTSVVILGRRGRRSTRK